MDRQTALIVIDVQKGFDHPSWGPRNNPGAEAVIARLLEAWRGAGRPIIHVQHLSRRAASPLAPGQSGVELKDEVRPLAGETVITKSVNSAFIGTDLEKRLRGAGIKNLVITGLCTDHCVSTTARMGANLGYRIILPHDAAAAFDRTGHDGTVYPAEEIHRTALASLHGEFATVVGSESLLEDRLSRI
ncbi:MAG TPA: cysteine hydrolase family protein [Elusimicrobiota bacterium]|nr:cysteine hydrolase family protein [Elusimicrobiota bacterium]